MAYLFRCTYCNHEEEVNPWDMKKDSECEDCGEPICVKCLNLHEEQVLCDSCLSDRTSEPIDEVKG